MSRLLCILAACLFAGAGWSCEREQCEAGVKDGKVEISDDLAAYFEFKEGSEWVYIEEGDSNEYFARVYNHENSVGTGEETTIRCILGRDIVSRLESNLDTVPTAVSNLEIVQYLEKDAQEDTVQVVVNCFLDLYMFSYDENNSVLLGRENTKYLLLDKYVVNNTDYFSVLKFWKEHDIDTLYYAPEVGLVKLNRGDKEFQLKSFTLL